MPLSHAAQHSLPAQFTSFIGREDEINALAALLVGPACRLVSLVGPGGVGKTRVAITLAERLAAQSRPDLPRFADGVWFVALQAVDSTEQIVAAIANVLRCPPPGTADPHEHLLAYLQPRHLLLVLDTFEHLRTHATLLTAILTQAPDVKLLITSREALNLAAEWRYPLDGFPLPAAKITPDLAQSDAVRLFVERAQHVRPRFDLAAEHAAVLRICQLVEGIPLALELAATWVSALSCAAIADEIGGNLAFLTSGSPQVSERHRSMRAIFDASWSLLGQDERTVFAQLSVFRSGFQHPAAAHVAGAQLTTLMALVDKSLLRWAPSDRYQIHELLRQYAAERLEQLDGAATGARDRHCAYYTDFLAQHADDVMGRRQREALLEIAAELENVRAAWQHALQHRHIAEIQRAAYTFYLFHDYSSRYHEGADLFAESVRLLDDGALTLEIGPTLAELLVCLGWISIRLGQLGRARETLERSQRILTRLAIAPRPGPGTDPLTALGTLACVQGDYTEAARLGAEARQQGEARADEANLMYADFVLTSAAFALGHYAEARRSGERACMLAERVGDGWFMAYLVANLGHIARATDDYPEAMRQYQLSYTIREEFGDPEGMAVALTHLGQVALLQHDPALAATQFQRGLAIYHAIDDRGGIATALDGLGRVAVAAGAYEVAAQHFHEALQIANTISFVPRTHAILTGAAELLLLIGAVAQAAGLLVAILRHPASDHETSDRARSLLGRCAAALAPSEYVAATQGRQTIDLAAISAALQAAAGGIALERAAGLEPATVSQLPSTALDEPLTERELAVLRLIADGYSNREISDRLVISLGTTKWYVNQIFGKLGVHSRTQALIRAREISLLT